MTTRPPVPVHPRLNVRLAYLVQRVLRPHAGFRWLSARIEAFGLVQRLFTSAERETKTGLFGCRMCGQCTLPVTGYVCPMGCPKEMRNGPCGGVGADGSCEVYPELRCVWVDAYERADSQGRVGDLRLLHRPIDNRRWGQSSWLNYWQGRDEGLWVGQADDGGPALSPAQGSAPSPGRSTAPGQEHDQKHGPGRGSSAGPGSRDRQDSVAGVRQ